jgi:Ca2+-binding RTX toxin-like protein
VSVSGGLLVHGQTTGGLNSGSDWDSATAGDQTVPANGTFTVIITGGDGNDSLTVLAKNTEIGAAKLIGEGGDDVLTGADSDDSLGGGDGDDRLVGAKGTDTMSGGAGNDTLVWNNGDGSDTMDGDAGNDGAEVNGSPTLGDVFTLEPNAGRIKFQRTNLVPFTLDTSTERFQVNGLGGNDSVAASAGVGALTLLSVDGGAGVDTVNGSDGADLILGGEGNDVLNGGGGGDRIVGDRGSDTMNGGAGDDTLVWNNGDGTDVVNGDEGRDDVEVNGAPAAGDAFTVQPNGARIKFDRPNLVPFSIDIGSSETMHANGLGGDDAISVGEVGPYEVPRQAARAAIRSSAAARRRRSSAARATTRSSRAAVSTSSPLTRATTRSTSATARPTWPAAATATARSWPMSGNSTSSMASRPSTARRTPPLLATPGPAP